MGQSRQAVGAPAPLGRPPSVRLRPRPRPTTSCAPSRRCTTTPIRSPRRSSRRSTCRAARSSGRAMLDQALAGGVGAVADAPESLRRLFADIEHDPEWVDLALVEHGARVFRRWGTAVFRFAGAITLEAYSESSVAKPLALTGAYAGDSTRAHASSRPRRSGSPSPSRAASRPAPPAAPRRCACASCTCSCESGCSRTRSGISRRGACRSARATRCSRSWAAASCPASRCSAMGYRPSMRDIEAMMHFWRYVGHLMGVRPRWYPASLQEAAQLVVRDAGQGRAARRRRRDAACASRTSRPSRPTRKRRSPSDCASRSTHRVHLGYTRFFLAARGRTVTTSCRPPACGRCTRWCNFPFIFGAETLRRLVAAARAIADRVARRSRDRWFAHHMGGQKAEYRPPANLTR